jgi:hypothetical protein
MAIDFDTLASLATALLFAGTVVMLIVKGGRMIATLDHVQAGMAVAIKAILHLSAVIKPLDNKHGEIDAITEDLTKYLTDLV